jgi:hypothetical protein
MGDLDRKEERGRWTAQRAEVENRQNRKRREKREKRERVEWSGGEGGRGGSGGKVVGRWKGDETEKEEASKK